MTNQGEEGREEGTGEEGKGLGQEGTGREQERIKGGGGRDGCKYLLHSLIFDLSTITLF